MNVDPIPIEVVPPEDSLMINPYQGLPAYFSAIVAPYLPVSLVRSIGSAFLKMPVMLC